MANRVYVVPSLPPDFLPGVSVSPQMVKDLLAISEIAADQIEAVTTALEREPGFPNSDRLAQLIRGVLRDERRASALVTALLNVPSQVGIEQVIHRLREWREADAGNAEQLPAEALEGLEEKLPRLVRDYPALQRCRKARRLESMLGNSVEAVELISDLRPVFNEGRDSVEGMFPLTTMKIQYEGQDGELQVLELRLSAEMLEEVVDKARKAQQKMRVLKESVCEWMPNGLVELD